jgi:hypothetical protein
MGFSPWIILTPNNTHEKKKFQSPTQWAPHGERLHHAVGRAVSARKVRGVLSRVRFQNILRRSSKTRKITKIKLFLHLDIPSKRKGLGNTVPPSNKYLKRPSHTDSDRRVAKHVLGKEHVTVGVGGGEGALVFCRPSIWFPSPLCKHLLKWAFVSALCDLRSEGNTDTPRWLTFNDPSQVPGSSGLQKSA